MGNENDDLDLEGREGLDGDVGDDAPEGSEDGSKSGEDSNKVLADYKAALAKAEQDREAFKKDLEAHKQELATTREKFANIGTALGGAVETKEQAEEKRVQAIVRERINKLYPGFDKMVERYGQEQGGDGNQKEPSLAEKKYFSDALAHATDRATKMGFSSREGQEAMALLGDILITRVPAWNQAFYKEGRSAQVLDQVSEYLEKKVFGPYTKSIEDRVLAKLRRQGLLTREPSPVRREAAPQETERRERRRGKEDQAPDFNDPKQRDAALLRIAQEAMNGSEE